jgi:hypothetical protein
MMKRMLLAFGLLFLLALAAVVGLLSRAPPTPEPGVTVENFRRLRGGMKEEEVERLFGRPGKRDLGYTGAHSLVWEDEHARATVWFNELHGPDFGLMGGQWKADDGMVLDVPPRQRPLLERLRMDVFPSVGPPAVLVASCAAVAYLLARLARRALAAADAQRGHREGRPCS